MVTLEDLDPSRPIESPGDLSPEVLSLNEASSIVETLSSKKRRAIMRELTREPTNTATVAERVGMSVQNATYHLEKLHEAGLITIVGTHYSEKGREMDVYAPASSAIVINVDEGDA